MDPFSELFGDRRGYRPVPGDYVCFASAWPERPGLPFRQRGPYRNYQEARDAARVVFCSLAPDDWRIMVDECEVDKSGECVVIESTPVSFFRS